VGERVDLLAVVPTRVERSNDRAHARPDDELRPDAQAIHHLEDADVREPLGTAAGEHERHVVACAALRAGPRGVEDRQEQKEQERASEPVRRSVRANSRGFPYLRQVLAWGATISGATSFIPHLTRRVVHARGRKV